MRQKEIHCEVIVATATKRVGARRRGELECRKDRIVSSGAYECAPDYRATDICAWQAQRKEWVRGGGGVNLSVERATSQALDYRTRNIKAMKKHKTSPFREEKNNALVSKACLFVHRKQARATGRLRGPTDSVHAQQWRIHPTSN